MANKPPAFQFYVKDWLSSESVVTMTPEQRGWYIQLLCHAWNGDPIASLPAEDSKLKTLAGAGDNWATDKQAVLECFEVEGNRLVNRKLADQHRERVDFIQERSESGRRGAQGRWGKKDGSAMPEPLASVITNDGPSVFTLQSSTVKGKVTVTGSNSDDSRGEQEGKNQNQEPTLGETLNPYKDKLTLMQLLKLDNPPAWLNQILSESFEVRRKVICVAKWVDTKSTVWKGKPCFGLGGYRAMEESYDKFFAKVPESKRPHNLPAPTNGSGPDSENQRDSAAPDFFLCAKCDCILPEERVDLTTKNLPFHKGECGGRCKIYSLDDPATPDKCVCEDPMPDTNGDCPEMYGVSCRRCGKFVKYPEDSTPSKAFEIED